MRWVTQSNPLPRKDRRRLEKLYATRPDMMAMLKRCYDGTAAEQDWKQVEKDKVRMK
jgi:hypothetical protein